MSGIRRLPDPTAGGAPPLPPRPRPAGDPRVGGLRNRGGTQPRPDADLAGGTPTGPRLGGLRNRGGTQSRPDADLAADRRFLHQHGVASRTHLLDAGLTPRMIQRRVACGRYDLVHRGVYRLAAAPFTNHARLLAAVLAGGQHALASHRAAGWLWDLTDRPAVEFTVPHGAAYTANGATVHRTRSPGTPSIRHGIPVTNPLRTLLDLAALTTAADPACDGQATLALAFDRGVAAGLLTPAAVRAELLRERKPGRAGGPALEHVLEQCGPVSMRSPSVLQNAFARILRRAGLPDPEPEVPVLGGRFFIDYGYSALLLGFELEGLEFHGGPGQVSADHARRRQLTALGWTILVFTPEDVLRRPDSVAAEVRREVMLRRASLPA